MKKIGVLLMANVFTTILGACSAANIKEGLAQKSPADELSGARVLKLYDKFLEQAGFPHTRTGFVTGVDEWESWLVRQFTPVTESRQEFELVYGENKTEFVFRNGEKKGQSVGTLAGASAKEGRTFSGREGQEKRHDKSSVLMYVDPLRDYLLWPFRLREKKILEPAGERQWGGKKYTLVFASDQEKFSPEVDQYILWFDKDSGRLKYIEFTMRALMKSYRGALAYEYDAETGWPQTVYVRDAVGDEDYSHKIVVEKWEEFASGP